MPELPSSLYKGRTIIPDLPNLLCNGLTIIPDLPPSLYIGLTIMLNLSLKVVDDTISTYGIEVWVADFHKPLSKPIPAIHHPHSSCNKPS